MTAATTPAARSGVRSYKRRSGRLTAGQAISRERLWADYGLDIDGTPLNLWELFGREAPVALEIGFGMGEATAAMAQEQPDVDVLAVDVHTPGHGALLRLVESADLTNVRIADGDAMTLLRDMLAPGSLAEVRVFFPDPWPKRRHWKRRLVTSQFADLVGARLRPGGVVHVVTDWPHYAAQVRHVLAEHPAFAKLEHTPPRATTRYERQAIAAGRRAHDVVAVRRSASHP